MSGLLAFIQSHIEHAPILIFSLLLLAGFNIPIPEDGMLFISATLAAKNPELSSRLFAAVFLGAYFSDLICYSLGWFAGPKLLQQSVFARMVKQERLEKVHDYYQRYGVITLILGRFIPFGVRNALFLAAGIGKMHFMKFAVSDLAACTISTVLFFTIYYHHGTKVIVLVQELNAAIFVLALSIGCYFYFRNRKDAKATVKD